MKTVYTPDDFRKIYPYHSKYIKNYPLKYPCIVKIILTEGGIMGDYYKIYVAYPPSKTLSNFASFLAGLNYTWIEIKQ